MKHGKTIELFLANGNTESLIIAELSNWNGKAFKIPRTELKEWQREDLKAAGVYFLFCKSDEDNDGLPQVYIGESENVYERLKQHISDYSRDKEKYYWTESVVFVGNDLNKAMIRYLEDKIVLMAKESKRYSILTKNTYKNTILKESQICSMNEFLENIKLLIDTLGYKVLEPIVKKDDKEEYLYCTSSKKEVDAKALVTSEGFIVLTGSKASKDVPESFLKGRYNKIRTELIEKGILDSSFVFTKDYVFSSPSTAASIVLGTQASGNLTWVNKDGKTLGDIENS